MISIIIPVKNGGERLRRLLGAIEQQNVRDEVELVVVDSGSSDGTQELARSFGALVHEIPSEDFNHGGTRNLGASLARGEILVFTVDDALPVDDRWLEKLTAPLRAEERVAGAYSRHLPYDGIPPHQRYYIDYRFGPESRTQRWTPGEEAKVVTTMFSSVSSAIRKGVFDEIPFAEDVITGEDVEWCGRALMAGYEIHYVSESVVKHSHVYSLTDLFRRYFDQGAASKRIRASSHSSVRSDAPRFVAAEMKWLWQNGEARSIPYALVCEAVRFVGFLVGTRYRFVPERLRLRWSQWPTSWP